MIPAITVPMAQASVPVPFAASSPPPVPDQLGGALTFLAVPANASPLALNNNQSPNRQPGSRLPDDGEQGAEQRPTQRLDSGQSQSNRLIEDRGFTTSFMTQIIAQNGKENQALLRTMMDNPALEVGLNESPDFGEVVIASRANNRISPLQQATESYQATVARNISFLNASTLTRSVSL